jgi:DNA polymerase-3 subunit delta'
MPWSLIGNTRALSNLQRSLASHNGQRSYLFYGPAATGKSVAALTLAQALNCTAADRPCGECDQCRRIGAGVHSDLHRVTVGEADDGTPHKDILIGQMREVEHLAALAPYEGSTRVFIIDPAERLNEHAQNAFLKTLEEPPPHVTFILIAENTQALLDTVRSRCAQVPFTLVPAAEIEGALAALGAEPDRAQLLARLACGRPGWALAMLEDPGFEEVRSRNASQARQLPESSLTDRFDLAEKLSEAFREDRRKVFTALDSWAVWWRDVMLVQAGTENAVINTDQIGELREDAAAYSSESVLGFLAAISDAAERLDMNVQSRIAIEGLMLSVPSGRYALRKIRINQRTEEKI